jgi:hypothetical protein
LDTKAWYENKGLGQLLATNKRILFLSNRGGVEVSWKRVMKISVRPDLPAIQWPKPENAGRSFVPTQDPDRAVIFLELSTRSGNGAYLVPDAAVTEAVFNVQVKLSKMIRPKNAMSRHIPQDVRQVVWLRDEGRCVECGSESELQFDHTIPHSKGGANTVENIRILCRICNSNKRARI